MDLASERKRIQDIVDQMKSRIDELKKHSTEPFRERPEEEPLNIPTAEPEDKGSEDKAQATEPGDKGSEDKEPADKEHQHKKRRRRIF